MPASRPTPVYCALRSAVHHSALDAVRCVPGRVGGAGGARPGSARTAEVALGVAALADVAQVARTWMLPRRPRTDS